jgi:hypothetical protein
VTKLMFALELVASGALVVTALGPCWYRKIRRLVKSTES